ncbi:substrate-binding domain-containing protein [Photobacterium sp. Hal280]|uniref:substrate-binding domain-containing protein n=1 Tax=Photobacterium sp. Hal280 TaxID=3035163 RepID=UPI00301DDD93
MATIKDVAKHAGVSVATVSRVINKSPKASQTAVDAVTQAMRTLGYRPNANARALVNQSTNTLGVLAGDVSDPFFGAMVKAIDGIARQEKKHLLIGNGYHNAEQEREAIELLLNSRCESYVIHSKALSNDELIEFAREVPSMVLINRFIPEIANRCIALDNERGTYLATKFLISHGHQHIGYVSSNHEIEDREQRKNGYLKALTELGIPFRESYIEFGSPDGEGGESAAINLLAKNLPVTAIVAYNDFMAAGVLSVLDENGIRTPQDISLVGFDDGALARYLHPKLTTVRYPIQIMAEQAAMLSMKLAKNEAISPDSRLYAPTLVRRLSVRALSD